jgi:CHAT domain-containing protein
VEGDAARLKGELTPAPDKPRWRYLHLASHAFFEAPTPAPALPRRVAEGFPSFGEERGQRTYGRNPLLLSGLVLAGANQSPEKGLVTAEEVSSLDLRGLDLAVLSACETGRGKVTAGEGVQGLQQAFQAAGARTLVVSLWNVDDAATSVLMEEFYANLWQKKLSKLEALRQAQLTVLRHPERVTQRGKQLRQELAKRGVPEEALAQRGFGKVPVDLPVSGKSAPTTPARSSPAWWAAFVLSGDSS